MGDRIARNAKDTGRLINVLQTIDIAQRFSFHLSRSCLATVAPGSEGECCSGTWSEDAAYETFFAHGDPHDLRGQRAIFNEPEHREIVRKGAGSGDYFHEIRLENLDTIRGLLSGAY